MSGEAYVVLSHPADLEVAMRKNKAYMGSRYIEVFEARKMVGSFFPKVLFCLFVVLELVDSLLRHMLPTPPTSNLNL